MYWDNEHNVNRYEKAVEGQKAEKEKWAKMEREYNEQQEQLRNAPAERTFGKHIWLEDGQVWRRYDNGTFLTADHSDIIGRMQDVMAEQGYLPKDDYDMRVMMIESSKKVAPEHQHLVYDPAKDKYGITFLQHQARMKGETLEADIKIDDLGHSDLDLS